MQEPGKYDANRAQSSCSDDGGSVSELEHTALGHPDLRWSNPKFDSPSDIQDQVPVGSTQDKAERQGGHLEDGGDLHMKKEGKEPETRNAKPKSGSQAPQRKIVAVKKLKVENDANLERVLGLALRESEFLLGLSHSNVIKLEGFVEDMSKRVIWLVFPWEENGNLSDFLASGNWEIPERISLIYDVAKGVEYLHSQKPPIYHGDLKSLNVLVNSEYRAVLTDFGSARRLTKEDVSSHTADNDSRPRLGPDPIPSEEPVPSQLVFCASTNTLTLTCDKYTLRWAAPELLRDETPSLACDIWALGWIAYEIMTNTIPFHDVNKDTAVVLRVIQGDLPSLTAHARMTLIQALCSLMGQCWNLNPEERPTAHGCRKSISWMPIIVPAPTHAMDTEASQARHSQLLWRLGLMYGGQGDYVNAAECFTKALSICPTNGYGKVRADALYHLAEVHRIRAQDIDAIARYSESLQIRTEIGDREGEADCLWSLAEIHRHRNEDSEAIKFYTESLKICDDIDHKQGKADALWGLAEVHRLQGDYTEAVTFFSEALQIRAEIGDRQGEADSLWSIGEVHRLRNEDDDAIKFFSESLKISTDIGYKQGKATALWGLAAVYHGQGDYGAATRFFSETLQIRTDVGDRRGRADTLLPLAQTHEKQGHHSDAISLYMEASDTFGEIGDSVAAANALRQAADIRKRLEEAA